MYTAADATKKYYEMTTDATQTLYGIWTPRPDTRFTVEHYRVIATFKDSDNEVIDKVVSVEAVPIYTTTQVGTTGATGIAAVIEGDASTRAAAYQSLLGYNYYRYFNNDGALLYYMDGTTLVADDIS